jgi:hypothetical protein
MGSSRLDQLPRLDLGDDVGADSLEDARLGARRVVLRQSCDLLEQLRAASVVEVLRLQLLRVARQPVAHVVGDR